MIKAKHHKFFVWLSQLYTRYLIKLVFRDVKYIGEASGNKDLPVLMIANHFSWWDGFIQMGLNDRYFKKRFHFMMLEKELRKQMILRTVGACSVTKGSRGIMETLKHLVDVLQDSNNLYLFFPQGRIQSIYTYPFKFESGGLKFILENMNNDFQFVFNVNLIDYKSNKRPELRVYYKTYTLDSNATSETVEKDFNEFAGECLAKLKR